MLCAKIPSPFLVAERIGEHKRRFNDPYLHRICRHHFDHIEAESNVGHVEESEPVEGSSADETLFFVIDGIEGASEFLAATGLYLGKDEVLSITANQIDLSSSRGLEVFPKDLPSLAFKMEGSFALTPSPQREMPIRIRRRSDRLVQNLGDDAGKGHDVSI